jgi:hypothetical protein
MPELPRMILHGEVTIPLSYNIPSINEVSSSQSTALNAAAMQANMVYLAVRISERGDANVHTQLKRPLAASDILSPALNFRQLTRQVPLTMNEILQRITTLGLNRANTNRITDTLTRSPDRPATTPSTQSPNALLVAADDAARTVRIHRYALHAAQLL